MLMLRLYLDTRAVMLCEEGASRPPPPFLVPGCCFSGEITVSFKIVFVFASDGNARAHDSIAIRGREGGSAVALVPHGVFVKLAVCALDMYTRQNSQRRFSGRLMLRAGRVFFNFKAG